MLNWFKNVFGITPKREQVVVSEPVKTETKPKKTTAKKKTTKKVAKEDFSSMSKSQLLDLAKKQGIKANASLKKDEILARIKNG